MIATESIHVDNRLLQAKYDITAWFYDLLDFPWERLYRRWRPALPSDVQGAVLEAGVGTRQNLRHYPADAIVTGIDLCRGMLQRARKRGRKATCHFVLAQEDVTTMKSIPSNSYDWLISTFLLLCHARPPATTGYSTV